MADQSKWSNKINLSHFPTRTKIRNVMLLLGSSCHLTSGVVGSMPPSFNLQSVGSQFAAVNETTAGPVQNVHRLCRLPETVYPNFMIYAVHCSTSSSMYAGVKHVKLRSRPFSGTCTGTLWSFPQPKRSSGDHITFCPKTTISPKEQDKNARNRIFVHERHFSTSSPPTVVCLLWALTWSWYVMVTFKVSFDANDSLTALKEFSFNWEVSLDWVVGIRFLDLDKDHLHQMM